MTTLASPISVLRPRVSDTPAIPPLENGDHLTGEEFLRRHRAMPDLKKADLIEGKVFMPSPVSAAYHGEPHADVLGWLGIYRAFTQGVRVADNSTTLLDPDNIPQPDACLRIDRDAGGKTSTDESGFVVGAPELIVEVASTSAQYDLHEKLNVYRRTGVREYLVWRTMEGAIDVFVLKDGAYLRASVAADGIYRSSVFPGLWLNVPAMLNRDMAAVLRTAQEGIATSEHEAFVKRLSERIAPSQP